MHIYMYGMHVHHYYGSRHYNLIVTNPDNIQYDCLLLYRLRESLFSRSDQIIGLEKQKHQLHTVSTCTCILYIATNDVYTIYSITHTHTV